MKKILALGAAALIAMTTMVSAATLSFITTSAPFSQLGVTGPSRVTVTLINRAASTVSQSLVGIWGVFSNISATGTSFSYDVTQGPTDTSAVDFTYSASYKLSPSATTRSGTLQNLTHIRNGTAGVTVSYSAITTSGFVQSITAYFNNGNSGQAGDEMEVRFDVQAIPVPAAGLMLLSGLGGLAMMRRRKKA